MFVIETKGAKMNLSIEQFEVSVIIPCLNEESTVRNCVRGAQGSISAARISGEVIVVDNGSTDNTAAAAKETGARVLQEKKTGYGAALIKGLQEASGKFMVFADADESYDFSYIGAFVEEMRKGADFVIGSRFRGGIEKGAMPFLHRYLGTPVITSIVRLFFGVKVSDINCGMRGLTRGAYLRLGLVCEGMEFASEMIAKAGKQRLKIVEIPIYFRKDKRGRRSHLNTFKDGWRHLRFILLFSPKWLFLFPGMVLFGAGFLFMLLILFDFFSYLGIFSMLVCQSMIFLGMQFILYGISSHGFKQFLEYNRHEDKFYRIFKEFTIEKGIIAGSIILLAGLIVTFFSGMDIFRFIAAGESPVFKPDATKWGFLGVTLVILGFQLAISSFYICLFNIQTKKQP